MRVIFSFILILILAGSVSAQEPLTETGALSPKEIDSTLPIVRFTSSNYYLIKAFYPDYNPGRSEIGQENMMTNSKAAPLLAMWGILGDSILTTIRDLSGIRWVEPGIKVHLLKYFPVSLLYDPAVLPMEGIKEGSAIIAAPSGQHQLLKLIQMLCGRNLLQTEYPQLMQPEIARHPLMEPGPFRLDVMVMTLAVACAEKFIPADTLKVIFASDEWRRYNPGWEIYRTDFRLQWKLSADRPLVTYLAEVAPNSPLIEITAPLEVDTGTATATEEKSSAVGGGGRLGLTVSKDPYGLLKVVSIDSTKLAFNGGLRIGDKIRTVNGERVSNARQFTDKMIEGLGATGVFLVIVRNGETKELLFRSFK
jgi:hypothetical protein